MKQISCLIKADVDSDLQNQISTSVNTWMQQLKTMDQEISQLVYKIGGQDDRSFIDNLEFVRESLPGIQNKLNQIVRELL